MRSRVSLALALALVATLPARAAPASDGCEAARAANWAPATGASDPAGDVRVYAIQYKQEVRHVESYASFRHKMFCLVSDFVMPTADSNGDGRADRPTVVVLNEDAGLATLATGTRGAAARAIAACCARDPDNITGALAAFASLAATYQPAVAWYANAFPDTSPQRLILAAATDMFARGFMTTNSDLARAFGIFVVSSNNEAEFRVTSDPGAVAALHDPDLTAAYATGELTTVYEAVDVPGAGGAGRDGIDVYNQAWMWSPDPGVTAFAHGRYDAINGAALLPEDPRANVVQVNRKTPLTSIERQVLDLSDDGDMSAANTGPFPLPGVPKAKIGYGISLPAFMWGSELNQPFTGDPCARSTTWMRCLDARGVNLFLQPEANPNCCWADYRDGGWAPPAWQALSWLDSAWRAVADSSVHNIRYAVTPHLVGNLVDVAFDGQSVIFERCLPRAGGGDTCDGNAATNFVGAKEFVPCPAPDATRCDDPRLEPYSGYHREFVALAPWVLADCPLCLGPIADRERLAMRARAMLAGSGSPYENDYLETAVWADLDLD